MNEKLESVKDYVKENWHRFPLRACCYFATHQCAKVYASMAPGPMKVPAYIGAAIIVDLPMEFGGYQLLDAGSDWIAERVADAIVTFKYGRPTMELEEVEEA